MKFVRRLFKICTTNDLPQTHVFPSDTNGRTSAGEKLCRTAVVKTVREMKIKVKNVEYNYRPNFLRNPDTGRNLELDIFIELQNGRKYAIEFNGKQHEFFTPRFHKDVDSFHKQVQRDATKRYLCNENHIFLLAIPHNASQQMIEDQIRWFLS